MYLAQTPLLDNVLWKFVYRCHSQLSLNKTETALGN